MNKISLTLITVIVGALLVFTFLQMEKPAFEIENKFIVVPQNSIVANDMNNIINNIVNIASEQQNSESVNNERAMVEVDRLNETSMFKITILAQSKKDAEELSEQVTYNFLKDVAEYYNVKTDINIDLVKGGEAEKNVLSGILPIVFWALVGILVSILIVMIVELFVPHKKNERVVDLREVINNVDSERVSVVKNEEQIESTPVYDLQESVNSKYEFNSFQDRAKNISSVNDQSDQIGASNVMTDKSESVDKNEIIIENIEKPKIEQKQEVVQASDSSAAVRSGAPNNLPVVEFNAESSSGDEVVNETQSDVSKSGSDEPTEDSINF